MSKHQLLPDMQSLDSSTLLFQPIVAQLTACSWHIQVNTLRQSLAEFFDRDGTRG
jgi:hypothetical protein